MPFSDNPESDIYGANLYDKYLKKRVIHSYVDLKQKKKQSVGLPSLEYDDSDSDFDVESAVEGGGIAGLTEMYAQSCQSILVCTGVYCSSRDYVTYGRAQASSHNHRDFVLDPYLTQPKFVTQNVFEAVKLVFQKEKVAKPVS